VADFYGSHFEYGGVSSRDHGLILVNMDTARMQQVSGLVSGVYFFDKAEKRRRVIDNDYTEFPFSFEVEMITADNDCVHVGERAMTAAEKRAAEKWLFNRHNFRKFYLDVLDDPNGETVETSGGQTKRLYLNCRFINPEHIENESGVIGWRATLEADSGMWWQDTTQTTISVENAAADSTSVITVHVDTDLDDYTYPKVTVQMGSAGGSFTLINNTDDSTRMTTFDDIGANASVVLKGGINYVSGQYYEKFYLQNFPRLVDGDNNFTVSGNVESVTFEFNNRRML
jgi:hypothetical protein